MPERIVNIEWWDRKHFRMRKPVCDWGCSETIEEFPTAIVHTSATCHKCQDKFGIRYGDNRFFESAEYADGVVSEEEAIKGVHYGGLGTPGRCPDCGCFMPTHNPGSIPTWFCPACKSEWIDSQGKGVVKKRARQFPDAEGLSDSRSLGVSKQTVMKALLWWQDTEKSKKHPLTCGRSGDDILTPTYLNGLVVLACKRCGYTQTWIPKVIVDAYKNHGVEKIGIGARPTKE